jgi:hypothetical protein
MQPETWLVVTVAAAFLLLGVGVSPLAWVALLHRRSRSDRVAEQRFLQTATELRALQDRLQRCEDSLLARSSGDREMGPGPGGELRTRPNRTQGRAGMAGPTPVPCPSLGSPVEPPLIAVPNLAATNHDREAALSSLSQRYTDIWTLAESGAAPDVIARATGQPIGQIELILGLRRKIDGGRTTIPHAPHD